MIGSNVAQVMRRRMPRADVAPEMTVLSPEQSAELLNAARSSVDFELAFRDGALAGKLPLHLHSDDDLKVAGR